jgi:glycosyltransferase involved in cell wall biosynthesis
MKKYKSKITLVGKQMRAVGGIQAVNLSLQQALAKDGRACEIFSFRDRNGLGLLGPLRVLFSDMKRFYLLAREPGRSFILNVTGLEVLLFSLVCLAMRRKFYYWLHGNPRAFERNFSWRILKRVFLRFADAVIVLHAVFISQLRSTGARAVCIPNVVPQLGQDVAKVSIKFSKVIWVGRVSPEKNPDLAYQTMIELASLFPAIDFVFISPGQAEPYFRAAVRPSNFRFVDGSDFVPSLHFNESSLHLVTSAMEAMPGVLFESASCGARFVSTRCSPWVDDLVSLGHGVSVPASATTADVVAQVGKILQDDSLVFCTESVDKFLKRYNPQRVAGMWLAVLGGE